MEIMDMKLEKLLGALGDMKLQHFYKDNDEKIGNFNQAKEKAYDIDSRSNHFTTVARNLSVIEGNDKNVYLYDRHTDKTMPFSTFGLNKFCSTIGIPADYIKRCLIAGKTELVSYNMNEWIKDSMDADKELLIRTTDDRLYSVLTNRYEIFDDHQMLDNTYAVLADGERFTVTNSIVRPEYTKIRVASRETITIGDDELRFGFDIKNSRLGNGSLEISLLLYRIICANGCLIGGGKGLFYRQRHVGIKPGVFENNFRDMLLKTPDAVRYVVNNIEDSQKSNLNNDKVQNYLDRFLAQSFATKNCAGQVQQTFNDKYPKTRWGMINAITEVAQQYDYDTRENIEEFAGKILLSAR